MAKVRTFPASAVATVMPVASGVQTLALPANGARVEFKVQSPNGLSLAHATGLANASAGLFVGSNQIYADNRYAGPVWVTGGGATSVLRVWETRI